MVSVETLLYILRDDMVLLIEKKKGLGRGLYNGVGGKVERGETPIEAAIRECVEEVGIRPKNLEWMGLLEFYNDGSLYGFVHVFIAEDFEGEPKESDEARPVWFRVNSLPYDRMWEDDKYWLPLILIERKRVYGRFSFVDDWNKLEAAEVYVLESVDLRMFERCTG